METPTKTPKEANLMPAWKKGQSGNPNGRPDGQRNYLTIYREAIRKIGETKGMTPDEVEEEMEKVGLDKALAGDFSFWKDIREHVHGKPKQDIGVGAPDGGPIQVHTTVTFVQPNDN